MRRNVKYKNGTTFYSWINVNRPLGNRAQNTIMSIEVKCSVFCTVFILDLRRSMLSEITLSSSSSYIFCPLSALTQKWHGFKHRDAHVLWNFIIIFA